MVCCYDKQLYQEVSLVLTAHLKHEGSIAKHRVFGLWENCHKATRNTVNMATDTRIATAMVTVTTTALQARRSKAGGAHTFSSLLPSSTEPQRLRGNARHKTGRALETAAF